MNTSTSTLVGSFLRQNTVTREQAQSVYPEIKLTYHPDTDVSLATQVKRQFAAGIPRHITNNIYRLQLSKTETVLDKPDIDKALESLGLEPKHVQYIGQTNGDLIVNLTVTPSLIANWSNF